MKLSLCATKYNDFNYLLLQNKFKRPTMYVLYQTFEKLLACLIHSLSSTLTSIERSVDLFYLWPHWFPCVLQNSRPRIQHDCGFKTVFFKVTSLTNQNSSTQVVDFFAGTEFWNLILEFLLQNVFSSLLVFLRECFDNFQHASLWRHTCYCDDKNFIKCLIMWFFLDGFRYNCKHETIWLLYLLRECQAVLFLSCLRKKLYF